MNVKNLWLTVGNPACGKSTWVAKNAAYDSAIISRDAIRFSIIDKDDDYFAKEGEVFKKFVADIQDALEHHENVYADATHLNERSRNKLLDALNLKGVNLYALYFLTPLDVCLERNAKRAGRQCVPEDALKRMYFSITDPAHDKKYKFKVKYINENGESIRG